MIVKFKYKNINCSPSKMRLLLFSLKNQYLIKSINNLEFIFKKSAFILIKLFKNILNNIYNNLNLKNKELIIKNILINKGKTLKKRNFFAKGRSGIIKKKFSHIEIFILIKG